MFAVEIGYRDARIGYNNIVFRHLESVETRPDWFEIECFGGFVAPNVLGKFGIVDEWIAIVLVRVDGFVAVEFFLRHGVLAMPCEHKIVEPRCERWVGVASENIVAIEGRKAVFVASDEIEIGASNVAFILVDRLVDCARIA